MYCFESMTKSETFFCACSFRTGSQAAPASASGAGGLPLDQSAETNPQMANFSAPRPMVAGNDALNVGAPNKSDFRFVSCISFYFAPTLEGI